MHYTTVTKRILLMASALFAFSSHAALIPVDSYSYNTSPNGSYPDSGGELTNGIAQNIAWGGGNAISLADVQQLTGWLNTSPSITFTFAGAQTVEEIVVWIADSDGAAGVGIPQSIRVTSADGFDQNFAITDPTGSGMTVPITLNGFSATSDSFVISAIRNFQWTMFSEVQFFDQSAAQAVPLPSALYLLILGFFGLTKQRR